MSLTGLALLLLALAPIAGLLRPRRWRRRRTERSGYRAQIVGQWLRFGASSAIVLALAGRLGAFVRFPAEFVPVQALAGLDGWPAADRLIMNGAAAAGSLLGIAAGLAISAWRAWRGRREGTTFGDATAIMPRSPNEYGAAALLAITAGVTEEAYFRLTLPLAAAWAFGSATAGFVGSALLFGAMHRYQGWRGVAATTVAGAALTAAYLAGGSLITVMLLHALGDLHHLVMRPALRRWIERRRGRV